MPEESKPIQNNQENKQEKKEQIKTEKPERLEAQTETKDKREKNQIDNEEEAKKEEIKIGKEKSQIDDKNKINKEIQIGKQHGNWHDRYYKILLLIPILLLVFSFVYMLNFYSNNNDIIYKDVSLTGGTSVTLYGKFDIFNFKQEISSKLEDVNIREIYDLITQEQKALVIETKANGEQTKKILEEYLGYKLDDKNSSFESTGATLSENFYKQLLTAMLFAFIFMAVVVFIIFRTFVPSTAVIISAFADILMTLVSVNMLGMKMSGAGIVAFLMLIGYSVDTDILLTIRVLKRTEDSLNKRIFDAFKTGITMTIIAIVAVVSALLIVKSFSAVLSQIFTILSIGLCYDLINTWITNVSILKWYMLKKEKK